MRPPGCQIKEMIGKTNASKDTLKYSGCIRTSISIFTVVINVSLKMWCLVIDAVYELLYILDRNQGKVTDVEMGDK